MIEHHIQREIINRLMRNQRLRFSDLKTEGMESNIFMYHITQLKRAGYITKDTDGHYHLLHKGLRYVDNLHVSTLRPNTQPKIIAILALQNNEGSWLMAERKLQPYITQRMFISGQQHFGESFQEQPLRELSEKGLPIVKMTYRGLADIQIADNEGILTHVLAHVHYGVYNGETPPDDTNFHYVWHNLETDKEPLMSGTKELYEQLKKNEPFTFIFQTK